MVNSAYVAGIVACAAGQHRDANPHRPTTDSHASWNAGWYARNTCGADAFPTPAEVKAARVAADLTQPQAAALVHWGDYRRWSERETGKLPMPQAEWELFNLKVQMC